MKKIILFLLLVFFLTPVAFADSSPTPVPSGCKVESIELCTTTDAIPNYEGFKCRPGGNADCSHTISTETGTPINILCTRLDCASGTTPTPTPPPPPCIDPPQCTKINTALGVFSTNPGDFVKTLFGIILSLAGGVALILIMISGYRLMFSQGNPEKVQQAREQLTSAIVGLLFIIFSMTILQIIGVDILQLPGLGR